MQELSNIRGGLVWTPPQTRLGRGWPFATPEEPWRESTFISRCVLHSCSSTFPPTVPPAGGRSERPPEPPPSPRGREGSEAGLSSLEYERGKGDRSSGVMQPWMDVVERLSKVSEIKVVFVCIFKGTSDVPARRGSQMPQMSCGVNANESKDGITKKCVFEKKRNSGALKSVFTGNISARFSISPLKYPLLWTACQILAHPFSFLWPCTPIPPTRARMNTRGSDQALMS